MHHGAGKQAFRDFSKDIHSLKKQIINAINKGEKYTVDQISSWIDEVLANFLDVIESLEVNVELWQSRAEHLRDTTVQWFINNYDLSEDDDNEEPDIDDEQNIPGQYILGFPVISEQACFDEAGHVRPNFVTTIEDLREYINDIPRSAIYGIIEVFDENGKLIGWSVCVGNTR